MAQIFLLFIALLSCLATTISGKPLEKKDSAEIIMKIEKLNEQLPGKEKKKIIRSFFLIFLFTNTRQGVQARKKDDANDETKPKKTQKSVYYVNTKVNGKFGKSVQAFTSEEFVEKYPALKLA